MHLRRYTGKMTLCQGLGLKYELKFFTSQGVDVLWSECFLSPPNSHVGTLLPNVMVFEDGGLWELSHEGRSPHEWG